MLDITYYDSAADFFERNAGPFLFFSTKAGRVYSEASYPDGVFLVFGREDRGLGEDLLRANGDRCVRIPMLAGARSLNLSNTVAVGVFEALRHNGFPNLERSGNFGIRH